MSKRKYLDYLQDIYDAIISIEDFVKDLTFDDFKFDQKTIYAVVRCFEIIGEATKNIPKSVRNKYQYIPWQDMAGMRDKLIHEYFGVDIAVLWKTILEDLPKLKPLVPKVIEEMKDAK